MSEGNASQMDWQMKLSNKVHETINLHSPFSFPWFSFFSLNISRPFWEYTTACLNHFFPPKHLKTFLRIYNRLFKSFFFSLNISRPFWEYTTACLNPFFTIVAVYSAHRQLNKQNDWLNYLKDNWNILYKTTFELNRSLKINWIPLQKYFYQ